MIKPILFSTIILFFAACGGNTPPVVSPQPTTIIQEQVDGPTTTPDTLPQEVILAAEKNVAEKAEEKPRPTKIEGQSSKPGKKSLHGTWELQKINGAKEPFKMLFPNKVPNITFDLKTNTLSGNNGCNSYNGPFVLKNGILTISDLISTRMFCEDVKESLFMTTLKMANNYRTDDKGNLWLKLDDEDLMMFTEK